MRFVFFPFLCFAFCVALQTTQAQSVFEDAYTREYAFGLNIASNGGFPSGVYFRYGKVKTARVNNIWGLEIAGIKHPKERKVQNPFGQGNAFVYGKVNYLFSIRPEYGKDLILFRKAPNEGVQVDVVLAAGPSIAVIKPYMILYDYSPDGIIPQIREERYDPNIHTNPNRIAGRGSFFSGFGQSDIALGLHLRLAMSFEVGAFQSNLTGIEAGFLLEAFDRTITILQDSNGSVENSSVYNAAYLSFFFGGRK
ncbi:MAG: hypothetical protein KatS3mg033_0325 [Thermonema sp.]|uniref:hypothetical protein n=1 Tax=Thermonema TaxID=28194 RepID=UPI00068F8174|nr:MULTISPECIES: hypothetical protein [Thermonema]GIV38525.1 MAG: hypothetical protein KatS3mg033_0325 [Thermonema sp.]